MWELFPQVNITLILNPSLKFLKIEHLFSQSCLKFVYKFKKSQLPKNCLSFQCVPRSSIHDHDTRGAEGVDTIYTRTHMAAKCIRSHLPVILNDTPAMIINKINTHSIQGFSLFIKRYYLSQYTTQCQWRGWFTCNNWFFFIFPDVSKLLQLFLTVAGSISCFYKYCVIAANVIISIKNLHIHSHPSSSYASYHHPNPITKSNIWPILPLRTRYINDRCFSVRKLAQHIQDFVNFEKFISPPRGTHDRGYCLDGLPSIQHPLFT